MIEESIAQFLGVGVEAAGGLILLVEAGSAIVAIGYVFKKILTRNYAHKEEIKSLITKKAKENEEKINKLQGCADNINLKCDNMKVNIEETKVDVKDIRTKTQVNSENIAELTGTIKTHIKKGNS